MKPQDLRIGNWVFCPEIGDTYTDRSPYIKEFCFQINQINIWGVRLDIGHGAVHKCNFDQTIEPIPISEDWLVKFGFQKEEMEEGEGHYYSLRLNNSIYCDLTLLGVFENGVWEVVLFPYGKFFRFKYINQVQNIVFELTGKELDNKY